MCHLHINTLARWVGYARIRIKLKDFVTKLLQTCYLRWGPLPDLVTPERDFPLLAEQPFSAVGPPTVGALLVARFGASAIPTSWLEVLLRGDELLDLL